MKKRIVQIVIVLIIATFSLSAQQTYYYYQGCKINLTVDSTYLNIIADSELQKSLDSSSISRNLEIERDSGLKNQQMLRLKFKTVLNEQEYLNAINTLKENLQVKYIFPYFKRQDAEPIGTSDIFYIKLKDIKDVGTLENLVRQQNMKILQQVAYTPLWYVVSIQNSDFSNAIDASNHFFETGLFENTDPAFMFNFRPDCTNDPMFDQLWGLSNSSNPGVDVKACDAWNITRGANIKVAVVDQGIYMTHNDLSANIFPLSFDAQSGTSPSVFISGNSHGTHVAGTVAAVRNNNLQVVGVAPESALIGVSHDLYISPTISSELAGGINWAWQNGADIITNSWGDQGGAFYDDLHSAVLEDAIMSAIRQGRNGKGSVVTFAAGNHAPVMDYPAYFNDSILTVGAIESYGYRASFSGYGNPLDVVAPGVNILSTLPYNSTGYYDGTSMATPHVAGIAALVLSVNPTLTGQQVRDIIESTAQKVGGYNYQTDPDHPNGTWSNEMGYGLVNAYAAVQAAGCQPVNFTNQTVTTNTTVTSCSDINIQNVKVQNGAKLTLEAAGEVNIISDFEVDSGSEVEIK
jgi:subtilisin family serine protease